VESLKVTLPVGVLDSPNEAIVAENVTGFPCADGFRLLAIAVVLAKCEGHLAITIR
jgi:hypothetical protein